MTIQLEYDESDWTQYRDSLIAESFPKKRQLMVNSVKIALSLGAIAYLCLSAAYDQAYAIIWGALIAIAYLTVDRVWLKHSLYGMVRLQTESALKEAKANFIGSRALTVDETGITSSSRHGSFTFPWSAVQRVKLRPEYVTLQFSNGQSGLIPKRALPGSLFNEFESLARKYGADALVEQAEVIL